jgi:protein-S-isoprenylcysteine O-methyltransferase Ste14
MPDFQDENADASRHGGDRETPHVSTESDAGIAKRVATAVLDRRWAFVVVRFLKKERTRAAFILAVWCLAEGVYFRERPFALTRPNVWVMIGLLLIGGGLAFRLAALGCIRKKEQLATDGVYSLCRHPLYLGSILLASGFCTLLADVENFVLATMYFVVFYPLTIFWEEMRLDVRYGKAHRRYRARTPTLLPLGRFRSGEFTWRAALSRGGALLLSAVVILLASVELMAEVLSP